VHEFVKTSLKGAPQQRRLKSTVLYHWWPNLLYVWAACPHIVKPKLLRAAT